MKLLLDDEVAVKKVLDSAPASLDFIKFEQVMFVRFALVPDTEAVMGLTHYHEKLGNFHCLGGESPVCCNAIKAARPSIIAPALQYLNASRVDGTLPETETPLISLRLLRISDKTLEMMQQGA